jgi:hypothetical protein
VFLWLDSLVIIVGRWAKEFIAIFVSSGDICVKIRWNIIIVSGLYFFQNLII